MRWLITPTDEFVGVLPDSLGGWIPLWPRAPAKTSVDGAAKRLSSGLCQKKQHSPDGGALYLTFSLPSRRSLL